MHGAHVALLARRLTKTRAQLVDQRRQAHVRHEGVRPELLVDFLLRDGLRCARRQEEKEIEALTRDVNGLVLVRELSRSRIEDERTELNHLLAILAEQ